MRRHGAWTMTWLLWRVWVPGTYKHGLMHGRGRRIWANGSVYVGEFANDAVRRAAVACSACAYVVCGHVTMTPVPRRPMVKGCFCSRMVTATKGSTVEIAVTGTVCMCGRIAATPSRASGWVGCRTMVSSRRRIMCMKANGRVASPMAVVAQTSGEVCVCGKGGGIRRSFRTAC